jgi:nicotinamide-nucleotide amidase
VTALHVLTVSSARLAGGDDPAAAMLVQALLGEGLPVASRQVVEEDESALTAALRAAVEAPGLCVVLAQPGGSAGEIVPRAVARLTGARLVLNEHLLESMREDFASRGQALPRRRDRAALLPQGAELWPVPSGEPAWRLETSGAGLVVLPAASPHLAALVAERLLPLARERLGLEPVTLVRTLRTAGLGAAEAEERLGRWLGREDEVAVSCLPAEGEVLVRLRARGASRALAERALERLEAEVARALGRDCYGRDAETLEAVVGRLLLERGLTLSIAESCTGGLLGHRITSVPGASRYFERGVVVYSNRAKEELLGVPEALLRAHGAVSGPVAEAMAQGAARLGGSPCALAVTGIAGPEGGTGDKPVGTVFVGVVAPGGAQVRRFRFAGGRESVKWQSTQAALDMLRRALLS